LNDLEVRDLSRFSTCWNVLELSGEWKSISDPPARHILSHVGLQYIGDGLRSQSLDWYWQN